MSNSGTPRITSGMTNGAKKNHDWPVNESSDWPPTAIVDAAISRPSSSAPESPMKTLAGWKFQGRNPMQMPTTITAMSGPTLPGSMAPTWSSWMP